MISFCLLFLKGWTIGWKNHCGCVGEGLTWMSQDWPAYHRVQMWWKKISVVLLSSEVVRACLVWVSTGLRTTVCKCGVGGYQWFVELRSGEMTWMGQQRNTGLHTKEGKYDRRGCQ